nr:hypothetical protein [Nitrobacter hamburgensis]
MLSAGSPEEARTAQNATMPYNDAERVDALKATGLWNAPPELLTDESLSALTLALNTSAARGQEADIRDHDLLLHAIVEIKEIIDRYFEVGTPCPEITIDRLVETLDRQELVVAIDRGAWVWTAAADQLKRNAGPF